MGDGARARRWGGAAVGVWAMVLLGTLALACGAVDLMIPPTAEETQDAAVRRFLEAAPPATAAAPTVTPSPAATPNPGPAAAALPPNTQFGVPLVRVGCHATPRADAEIAAYRPAGQIIGLAMVLIEGATVWYQETAGRCWVRAAPGPTMLVFSTRRRAECFALPPGPAAAAVTDCVVIDGASDRAEATSGDVAASAPPGSRCAAYRVVNESGKLRVQNLPSVRADERGLVTWTWPHAGEVGVESSTVTVMCIPGGAASVTLSAR